MEMAFAAQLDSTISVVEYCWYALNAAGSISGGQFADGHPPSIASHRGACQ